MNTSRMRLRYPIIITTSTHAPFSVERRRGDTLIEAIGATTDEFCAQRVTYKAEKDNCIDREMIRAQKDQCARECRNLWGPIWKYIWKEEWDANADAMREEREKALTEWRSK